MDQLRQTYNEIAKLFADEHATDTWDDDYLTDFAGRLPQGAKVLDLGCGAGNDSNKLSKYGFDVTGMDLADSFIELAKKSFPLLKFNQGDMRNLPYDENTFDGVFAKASLLHISKADIPGVLDEISRVLKPGGILHVAVKGGEGEGEIMENDYGFEYSRFFSYWKMDPFIAMLNKHQFQLLKQEVWRRAADSYTIWLKVIAENQKRILR
jgi:ubiquinone/menaquinone biosynthesis C-methylase UbiE